MKVTGHGSQLVDLLEKHFKGSNITGIEIGTGQGITTSIVLKYVPNIVKLYTIDPWTASPDQYERWYSQNVLDDCKKTAYSRLKDYGDRIVILPVRSDDALNLLPKEVDFTWIDGNHEGSQVLRDIQNYLPLVRKGGILGGHDYGLAVQATKVIKSILENELHLGFDWTWWIYV